MWNLTGHYCYCRAACARACLSRAPPIILKDVKHARAFRLATNRTLPLPHLNAPRVKNLIFFCFMGRVDKLDSSFSRSRSSSMSSLENITSEAIQCLAFADSYTRKSEPTMCLPTLWVGTSLGSVVTIMIGLPEAESRSSQPVVVSLVGATIFRLKGSILGISFLDCNGALIPYSFESWRDENKKDKDRKYIQV